MSAGRESHGHRFMAPQQRCRSRVRRAIAPRWSGAARCLSTSSAVASSSEQAVTAAAHGVGGEAVIDARCSTRSRRLVEWPVALAGRFDVPLSRAARTKCRSRRCRTTSGISRSGRRRSPAARVRRRSQTSTARDPAQVIAGNERVIRPRLADAAFFYARGPQAAAGLAPSTRCARVTFQTQLGSLHDKSERVRALAAAIAAAIGGDIALAERAAELRQVRPADRHGRRVPGAAGRHGALPRAARRRAAGGLRSAAGTVPAALRGRRVAGDAHRHGALAGGQARHDRRNFCDRAAARPGTRDPFGLRRAALDCCASASSVGSTSISAP